MASPVELYERFYLTSGSRNQMRAHARIDRTRATISPPDFWMNPLFNTSRSLIQNAPLLHCLAETGAGQYPFMPSIEVQCAGRSTGLYFCLYCCLQCSQHKIFPQGRCLRIAADENLKQVLIPMDLSVVIPVYNEVDGLDALHKALTQSLNEMDRTSEVIFVDDGSTDGSARLLDRLTGDDPRVKVLHLRRNYGQTAAIMAGIQHSIGDVIVPMDADGQNDPSDIPRLIGKLNEGFDVVSGWRKDRQDRWMSRRFPSVLANRLISTLLGLPLHDYGCTLKAYRRDVIEDIRLYGEMHRFIPIYAFWEGARVTELPVRHHARQFGRSKYGLGRVVRVILDLLILVFMDRAFDRPIQFFGRFGLWALLLASLTFGWSLALKFGWDVALIQTPLPLLAATTALSGILFIMLGIIAEVLARTYFESRGRPPYKLASVIKHPDAPKNTTAGHRW